MTFKEPLKNTIETYLHVIKRKKMVYMYCIHLENITVLSNIIYNILGILMCSTTAIKSVFISLSNKTYTTRWQIHVITQRYITISQLFLSRVTKVDSGYHELPTQNPRYQQDFPSHIKNMAIDAYDDYGKKMSVNVR